MSLVLRTMLVGVGVVGLYLVWLALAAMQSGSEVPYDVVLLAIALAGGAVGILWIRKIANDVGEV